MRGIGRARHEKWGQKDDGQENGEAEGGWVFAKRFQ
jgi:hypothetical protein